MSQKKRNKIQLYTVTWFDCNKKKVSKSHTVNNSKNSGKFIKFHYLAVSLNRLEPGVVDIIQTKTC